MLRNFNRVPVGAKISLAISGTAVLSVAVFVTTLMTFEWREIRAGMVLDLRATSRVIASNSTAALAFNDERAAQKLVNSLAARAEVTDAVLLDASGTPIASYSRAPSGEPLTPSADGAGEALTPTVDGAVFREGGLYQQTSVELDSERIGTLIIRERLDRLYNRFRLVGVLALVMVLVAALIAITISNLLRRALVTPLVELANTAREVRQTEDYSLRVEAQGEDELGVLSRDFNDMLRQIQERDRQLIATHGDLERRVDERTLALREEISERKRVETSLREFSAELERSNRDLEDFAYVTSHDLQEPLRKIQAFGDRLRTTSGDALNERSLDYLARMQSAAQRMTMLIADLLKLSRVSTRGEKMLPVDVNTVLSGVISDLEVAIQEARARIEISPLPRLIADQSQLRQLMQNLLSNAIKFSRDGVSPEIAIRPGEPTEAETERDFAIIEVSDNGIGFEQRFAERIFGVFQRLHARGRYAGTGVGLAVCRKIVERHRGTITVTSQVDEGTTFRLALPAFEESGQVVTIGPETSLKEPSQ